MQSSRFMVYIIATPAPLQALCSSNLPKLLERDTPLFVAILGDLFPRKALPMPSHDSLHRGVAAAAKKTGLQPLVEQTTKIDQLHETMEVSTIPISSKKTHLVRPAAALVFSSHTLCCGLAAHASHYGGRSKTSAAGFGLCNRLFIYHMVLSCFEEFCDVLLRNRCRLPQRLKLLKVRFGVALVGHAGAGKSALLRLLAEGSTWLRNEELQQVS